MTESFADVPISIADLRSDKSGKAKDWTVRDMLIAILRDIDNGKLKFRNAVLAMHCENDKAEPYVTFRAAGCDRLIGTLGLLERVKHQVNVDSGNWE